jgi:predicted alpha/beta-fold hydrolase
MLIEGRVGVGGDIREFLYMRMEVGVCKNSLISLRTPTLNKHSLISLRTPTLIYTHSLISSPNPTFIRGLGEILGKSYYMRMEGRVGVGGDIREFLYMRMEVGVCKNSLISLRTPTLNKHSLISPRTPTLIYTHSLISSPNPTFIRGLGEILGKSYYMRMVEDMNSIIFPFP